MRKTFFWLPLLIFIGTTVSAQIANPATGGNAKLEQRIKAVENNLIPYVPVQGFPGWNILERMKHYKVPGVSIAVIKDYKIDWAKAYGLADTIKKTPVTTETMFSAGSISKLVMAAAALRLVQEGKLSLDEPINNYLTSWKLKENEWTQEKPVTLRMLLSHTGGTSQSAYFGYTPDKNPLPTVVEILSGAPGSETNPVVVNSEPGKGFRYSGGGSLVAQLALMDVTKKDFTTLTQEMIFVPLGMKNATFAQPLPGKFAAQASWGYSAASWYKGMPYVYPQQAAAGLYTTASDLAKFFIDIQQSYQGKGKTLSAAMTKQMFTPQAVFSKGENTVEHIGLGPFLLQRPTNKDNKGVYFYFDGTNAGFTAFARASVEGGNGVVVLLNSGDDFNGLGKEIIRAVAQTYNWHNFLPETVKPIALDAKELDKYAGRYRKGPDEVVYVRREKGYLVSKINDGEDVYCFPVAKDTIVLTDFNLKSYFGRDAAGNVVSLRSVYQDKPMPKMAANELTLSELMKAGRYAEAKTELKKMNLDASQLTYLAYETFGKKPLRLEAVKAILEVAVEQHPNEAIVHNRWGDLYAFLNDAENATKSFQKAAALDPSDAYAKEMLRKLGK